MILQKVKLLLIPCIFMLISLSSSEEITPRIVGGNVTSISSYPWQVAVIYRKGPWCGGSIISRGWILTAAHCVYQRMAIDYQVRAGSTRWNAGGTLAQAKRVIHHSRYNEVTTNYDIALIQLTEPLTYKTGEIENIVLSQQLPINRISLWVSGWGARKYGTFKVPDQLHAVAVRYIPRAQCNKLLGGRVTEEMLCAGNLPGGKDSCTGDSGGPLIRRTPQLALLGIVSWALDCGDPQSPNVYTSVPRFLNWIKSIFNKYNETIA